MTIIDSRVQRGKLTLTLLDPTGKAAGTALDISCQPTSVTIKSKVNEGSATQVLCGDSSQSGGVTDYTLELTAIQDFDDPQGFVLWAFANDGKKATFEWTTNDTAKALVMTGTVTVRPIDIGGAVGVQITSAVSWPCAAKPTIKPVS